MSIKGLTLFRIALASIGMVSVFVAPAWVPAVSALVLAIRWRAWEVLAIGALADLMWFPTTILWGIPVATLLAVSLLWLLEPLRNELLS